MADARWTVFEDYVDEVMAREHIVAVAVAIAQDGDILYAKGFGTRDLATGEPVTPESVFGCGSVSKSFTAMAITQLADKGLLSVDDPVIKHLPEFRLRGIDDMSTVRVRHLLSHTTGCPPMGRHQEKHAFTEHLEYLATQDYEVLGKPGEYFSYCNDTFLLLGAIIERLSGRRYRTHMSENVVAAIGMPRTTYDITELPDWDNVTAPYIYKRKSDRHEAQPWPDLGNYEVGGGVRSNVLALVRYGHVYVNDGVIDGRRIVSEEGLLRMRQPMYKTNRNTYYCFGLNKTPDYAGLTLVEHGGGQAGVSANFGFVPEKRLVAAVLTNVSGRPAGALWLAAVNTALGLPIDKLRSIEPHYGAPVEHLRRFAGTYKSAEGGELRVSLEDSAPKVEVEEQVFALRASDERSLVFRNQGQDVPIRFYFDQNGETWAAFYHSRMLRKVKE
jgi:CubicO group peptidase (beta-lactamase class C family)